MARIGGRKQSRQALGRRRLCCLWPYPLRTDVRTDERNVSANGRWREHYTDNDERKHHPAVIAGCYHSVRATHGNAFNIFSTATFGQ
jgi:hypothetical protein